MASLLYCTRRAEKEPRRDDLRAWLRHYFLKGGRECVGSSGLSFRNPYFYSRCPFSCSSVGKRYRGRHLLAHCVAPFPIVGLDDSELLWTLTGICFSWLGGHTDFSAARMEKPHELSSLDRIRSSDWLWSRPRTHTACAPFSLWAIFIVDPSLFSLCNPEITCVFDHV